MKTARPMHNSGAGALLFPRQGITLAFMLETSNASETDEELMQRYCAGDAAAFDRLYARHRKALFGFLFNQSQRQHQEVDEVFQETWLKVIRNRRRYDNSQRFQPWLYAIARNCLIDRWRHLGAVNSLHVSDEESVQNASGNGLANPERLAASEDIQRRWQQALALLPPEQREAVLLKLETDMSLEQIAEVTSAGRETVKSRLRYAMNKLREQLAEVFHD